MNSSNSVTNVVTPPLDAEATKRCFDNVLSRPEWTLWEKVSTPLAPNAQRWDVK